jgi:hypothetical protein
MPASAAGQRLALSVQNARQSQFTRSEKQRNGAYVHTACPVSPGDRSVRKKMTELPEYSHAHRSGWDRGKGNRESLLIKGGWPG